MRTLVLYHWPCKDGIFAATAFYLHAKERQLSSVEWRPHATFQPVGDLDLQRQPTDVYLLDYAGPKNYCREIALHAKSVTVIDHHKTAAEDLLNNPNPPNLSVYFDMKKSGATLALQVLQPKTLTEKQRMIFDYIEDGDLWRWKLPDSKAFNAGLNGIEFDVHRNPGIFEQLLSLEPDSIVALGKERLKEQNKVLQESLLHAFPVQLGGKDSTFPKCLAARLAPEHAQVRSELGNRLAEESAKIHGFTAIGLILYREPSMKGDEDDGRIKCSLRSIGDVDTTVMSTHYGGGGHKNASAFMMPDTQTVMSWKL